MALRQWFCTLLALGGVFFVAPRAQAVTQLCSNFEMVSETNHQMSTYGWQSVNCYINRGVEGNVWLASITTCKLGFVSPRTGDPAAWECDFDHQPGSNETGVLLEIHPEGATALACNNVRCAGGMIPKAGGRGPQYDAWFGISARDLQPIPVAMSIGCFCDD